MRRKILGLGVLALSAAVFLTNLSFAGEARHLATNIPAGWYKHVQAQAGYQVAFPAAPKVNDIVDQDSGMTIRVAAHNGQPTETAFGVIVQEFPERLDADVIDLALDEAEGNLIDQFGG